MLHRNTRMSYSIIIIFQPGDYVFNARRCNNRKHMNVFKNAFFSDDLRSRYETIWF